MISPAPFNISGVLLRRIAKSLSQRGNLLREVFILFGDLVQDGLNQKSASNLRFCRNDRWIRCSRPLSASGKCSRNGKLAFFSDFRMRNSAKSLPSSPLPNQLHILWNAVAEMLEWTVKNLWNISYRVEKMTLRSGHQGASHPGILTCATLWNRSWCFMTSRKKRWESAPLECWSSKVLDFSISESILSRRCICTSKQSMPGMHAMDRPTHELDKSQTMRHKVVRINLQGVCHHVQDFHGRPGKLGCFELDKMI